MQTTKPTVSPENASAAENEHARITPRTRRKWLLLRQDIPGWLYRSLVTCSFLSLFVIWWWATEHELLNRIFLPTPESMLTAARGVFTEETLWIDVGASFMRVGAGFALSVVIAIPLGILIGSFRVFEALLQPLAEFVRYIPVPALIPILMVLFGIGEFSKIMLIWVGTFFQLLLMVTAEVRRVPQDLLQVSYTLGASRLETMRLVIWRSAMPGIFDALRLAHGWAWTYVVVAELIAANEGLGYRILKFSRFLQTPKIWIYLLVLGLIGLVLDFLFRSLNRRLFHWVDTAKP